MPQLFTNNAASALKTAITAAATSIPLQAGDGAKFPTPQNGDYFKVTVFQRVGATEMNWEVLKVTANANDVLTCSARGGIEGTTARAFNAGDLIELRLTAGAILPVDGGALTTALNDAPTVSMASSSAMSIGTAAANTLTITGNAQIAQFDSMPKGAFRRTNFTGGATLKHNANSLNLITSADIATEPNDWAEWVSLGGGNWQMVSYTRASGTTLTTTAAQVNGALAGILRLEKTSFPQVILKDTDAGADLGQWGMWLNEGGGSLAIGPQLDTGGGNQRLGIDRSGATRIYGGSLDLDAVALGIPSRVGILGQPGQEKGFKIFSANGGARWTMTANSTAETGGNAGSDFGINRYTDAGGYIDTPIYVTRSSGNIVLTGYTKVISSTLDLDNSFSATEAGIRVNGASGQTKSLTLLTNSVMRWKMFTDLAAESGSNLGANFGIARYSDAGAFIDTPIYINRKSGIVTLSTRLQTPALTVSGAAAVVTFDESDQVGTAGIWRFAVDGGDMRLDRNTSAARDLATYATMFRVHDAGTDFQDTVLSRMYLKDCGLSIVDKGASGTAAQVFDFAQGSMQTITATGAHSWAFANWPAGRNWGAMLVEVANGGTAAITFAAPVSWQLPAGGYTTAFADYMKAIGRAALQTSGIDQLLFWSDGFTTYGKLV